MDRPAILQEIEGGKQDDNDVKYFIKQGNQHGQRRADSRDGKRGQFRPQFINLLRQKDGGGKKVPDIFRQRRQVMGEFLHGSGQRSREQGEKS